MLTKTDINLIQGLLTPIHKDIKTIKSDISVLKTDVKVLKTDVGVLKTDVKNLQKDMTDVKKDTKKIKKIIENDFGYHERHNIHVVKNVQQIQKHLGMPMMTIDPPNNF